MLSSIGTAVATTRTTITIDVNFLTGVETFTTTGGALCPSGTATTDFHFGTGNSSSLAFSFHLTKTLVCTDGSGSFTIAVNAATTAGASGDQGGWSVVGGDDDYAGLRSGGNLVGAFYSVGFGIVDLYSGVVTK